jgi:hypothetical protein
MSIRSLASRLVVLAVAAAALAAAGTAPALAAKKTYEDKKLGYRIKIEDTYTQNPPKLTADEAYIVGDWYEDAAKFDSGYLRPTFQVFWFVEPKSPPPPKTPAAPAPAPAPAPGGDVGPEGAPPGGGEDGAQPGGDGGDGGSGGDGSGPAPGRRPPPPSAEDAAKSWRDQFRVKSFDEALDRLLESNTYLFGPHTPMADRWKDAEKDKTASKIPLEWFEVNGPSKKKKDEGDAPRGYVYVARLTLERPGETIHVGFLGTCSVQYTKRFQKEFPQLVRSFEELRSASDSRNLAAQQELEKDPAKRREQVRKSKLVPGWKCLDTRNYILVYHDEVEPSLVRAIGDQIEAIRAQLYEVIFPPDRPIVDVSIVRVCKDRDQYMGYGAPGGSAGYWSPGEEELVFYEDQGNKKDSLRVLYHEAFHQYIHYAVGEMAPHSWFNEGHGDFFAGHNYVGGKFQRDVFQERVTLAKEWKRNPKRPPLREWIAWTQAQYYGRNKEGLDGLANYALGWSLVYFLRTTKKPEYQGVLDRYFKTLKGAVTRARHAREEYDRKVKEATEKGTPFPERSATDAVGTPDQWLRDANRAATEGIDWDQIEKDWLAADN